jgi:hypothetical protein
VLRLLECAVQATVLALQFHCFGDVTAGMVSRAAELKLSEPCPVRIAKYPKLM